RRVATGLTPRVPGGPGPGERAHDAQPRRGGPAAHHGDGGRESARARLAGGRGPAGQGRDSLARTGGGAAAGALSGSSPGATLARVFAGDTCGGGAASGGQSTARSATAGAD